MLHMHHCDFVKAQNPPKGSKDALGEMASDCILMRTRLVSRVITNLYDEALRPFGLNSPQFALLLVISVREPASRSEIGRFHHQERSTLTRNLKIMLTEGWIEEVPGNSGGRARPIRLSKAGRRLLQSVITAWRGAQAEAQKLLGADGAGTIMDIASQIMKPQPTV
jgi:DNA-binding MarR family transcriptional regulator